MTSQNQKATSVKVASSESDPYNDSIARVSRREALAVELAAPQFATNAEVDWRDGGYYVTARIWIDFEPIEDLLAKETT